MLLQGLLLPRTSLTAKPICATCRVRSLCVPSGLGEDALHLLEGLVSAGRRLREGETLYVEGSRFRHLYAIRTGTLKTVLLSPGGDEQVTGFHLAGDVVGMDGIARGVHASSAVALDDAEICILRYALTPAMEGSLQLQQAFARLMSRELVRENGLIMLLGSMNADARLAAFLLNLSRRMNVRGFSAAEFHLRMSRAEIASYLAMTVETVSRTLTAFQQRRWIGVNRKHVRILDFGGLHSAFDRNVW
jgi:CRP/FNR family transcriptional regulator